MTKMFQNAIRAVKPGDEMGHSLVPYAYDMNLEDFSDLVGFALKGDPAQAVSLAFLFGFVMGNRATITRKLKRL